MVDGGTRLLYGIRMHEWTITYLDGTDKTTERVTADAWQVSGGGDLAFVNEPYGREPFFLRAFAKGVWLKVDLYS